jgi:hypothetical protein
MPPRSYVIMHPRARLIESDTDALCAWAEQRAASSPPRR